MSDLVVKVDEYEKGGETKSKYLNIGVMLEGNNGPFLLLDPTVNLAGVMLKQRLLNPQKAGDKVLVSIFEKQARQQSAPAAPKDEFDDSIPFR